MTFQRRDFLLSGAGLAAGALLAPSTARAEDQPEKKAVLKLSSQMGVIPGDSTEEKLAKMKQWGFDAAEPHGGVVGHEEEFLKQTQDAGLKVSAICWGSDSGNLVSDVVEKRGPSRDALKRAIDAAGVLGSTGVIYVPAFNGQTKLRNIEIRQILLDTLPELGEHAKSLGTRILLEPLNRGEAYFLRQVADGASICRDCKSEGVCMMGDFYHMFIEETSDMGAFISAGPRLHHVHLASRTRVLPGQDERSFVDGFKGLKMIGYQDYCSFECGVRGDREVEIPKSMAFLREQWEQA